MDSKKSNYLSLKSIRLLFSFYLLTAAFISVDAQVFQVFSGPISSKPSDSRSVNFLDVNNDGWEDLFISNGLQGGQADFLYLNDGMGQFTEVKDMDIVQASEPSDGASFADYNNDGHIDGVVSSWYGAKDLLYLNDSNGRLVNNVNAGLVPGSLAETAAFGDYNNDGWLDLYITNSGGRKNNYLYKNLKNGKFEQIVEHILVNDRKTSRGAVWGDFNNDGITDLFVANEDNTANDLFIGLGDGNFEKFNRGSIVVRGMGSMTGSWGDIDNDGDFDLFIGNSGFFTEQRNQLYKNFGDSFGEVTDDPVATAKGCTFGSAFGDYDNDGDLDLVVMNGFCNANLNNRLYENQGDGSFVDVSQLLAANGNICSFGAAWGDVNNDGFLDLAVANCKNNNNDSERTNRLMLNLGNNNNWLQTKLKGTLSNADAIGAKIKVKATINNKEVWQIREIRSQSGYAGQNSLVAHFGLGDANTVDSLIIIWPAGGSQVFRNVSVNQKLVIEEGLSTGLKDRSRIPAMNFKLFPNPIAENSASIRLSIENSFGVQKGSVFLSDSLGQLVWNQKINVLPGQNEVAIPVLEQRLRPGVYTITLQSGREKISRKAVVLQQ